MHRTRMGTLHYTMLLLQGSRSVWSSWCLKRRLCLWRTTRRRLPATLPAVPTTPPWQSTSRSKWCFLTVLPLSQKNSSSRSMLLTRAQPDFDHRTFRRPKTCCSWKHQTCSTSPSSLQRRF
uniref:Secreted protein n=1 Tax=Ixodes ricinus TaxID=34613 RepID=A0A6B0UMU7_IXORI